MASELGLYLQSINQTKENLIRGSNAPAAAAKDYPAFVVNRTLSYFGDCILFVNELNVRGLSEFHLTNTMQYEFLLHLIPKNKRFEKWSKPSKDDQKIKNVARFYGVSTQRAREFVSLLSEQQLKVIANKLDEGGKHG